MIKSKNMVCNYNDMRSKSMKNEERKRTQSLVTKKLKRTGAVKRRGKLSSLIVVML